MLINALERALPADRERLEQWLKKEEGTYVPEEKIAAVTALYDKMGIRALCDEKIRFYYEGPVNSGQGKFTRGAEGTFVGDGAKFVESEVLKERGSR